MTETLSIRIPAETKKRLDKLSKRAKRSKSLGEFNTGISELDSGQRISHEKVSKWLSSWGKRGETQAPR